MTRVGLVVNPSAGHGRGGKFAERVHEELSRAGVRALDLSGSDAAEALLRARRSLDRVDALVVVGGDGMAHLGVNATAGTDVPLGIIPAGSGNDLARCLGLPVDDVPAAVALITEALDRGPHRIDAIASQPLDRAGAVTSWTACVLSAGIDAAVNARANAYRWPRGHARYVRGVAAELIGFRAYGYRLTIDGTATDQAATLVAIANATSFGGGLRIAPQASMTDGLLDVVVADELRRREILALFPRLYRGSHLTHPAVQVTRAREVIAEPGHVPPPPVFGDGESVGRLPLRIWVEPLAVPLLAPAP